MVHCCAGPLSRGPQKFRQADVEKALRAAQAAGFNVRRFEISPDGKIVVVAGPMEPGTDPVDVNEWDPAV